jgi:hypothetical protein
VILNDEQATVSPAVIVVDDMTRSVDEVPQLPCASTVPPDCAIRKCPAVIEFGAFVSDVIAFAVAVARPFEVAEVEAGNGVAPKVSVAPRVPASLAVVEAGCAPLKILSVALAVIVAVIASSAVFALAIDITGRADMGEVS